MIVDDIMTSGVVTVDFDDHLRIVKELFEKEKFHHLLVIKNDSLMGIVSDRDYFKAVSPFVDTDGEMMRDLNTLNRRAHQIMSRNPKYLFLGASVLHAIELFNEYDISCVPILNSKEKPVGILTWRDVLRKLAGLARSGKIRKT